MSSHHPEEDYTAQLTRIVGALAVAECSVVTADVATGQDPSRVKMFTDGNLDKRFLKLQDQLEMLGAELDDLDDLIVEYVRVVPLAAYDTGCGDGDRFVRWVTQRRELTPEQRDLTVVIRSRHAVEELGRRNRMSHVRFQELASLSSELVQELDTNHELTIHINPIRLWASFESSLFLEEDDDATVGVEALFYACGNDVRTVVLDAEGRQMVRTLSDSGPGHLDELELRLELAAGPGRETLIEMIHDGCEAGLVAFS